MGNSRPTVTLLLPTYNEVDGLRAFFPTVDRDLFDDILIVDGGSTDGTVEFALDHGIRIMSQIRKGLGAAVFDAVSTLETDYVVEFSMDGNCMVDQLRPLTDKLREGYDLVVVSRYLPPAKSEDDTLVTKFGNWMFTKMIRCLGPSPITDSLTIYRGFRTDIIRDPVFEANLQGPVFEPLVSAYAQVKRWRVFEIPGDEPARIGGASKMRVFYNGSCILLMIWRMLLLRLGLR